MKIFTTEGKTGKMAGCKGCKAHGGLWDLLRFAEAVTFLVKE